MAITSRQGPSDKLDKNKLVSGEDALTLDKKEILYCVGPGDVRELATTKSVNDLLTAVPELYDKLQMLVGELENETLLQGILGDIDANTTNIAQNIADIDANVGSLVSHTAELSGKHIKESGSNANGSYIKFDNGTMICRYRDTVEIITNTLITNPIHAYSKILMFPSTFISRPVVSPAGETTSANTWANTSGVTTTTVNYRVFGVNATQKEVAGYIAVGRWK